MERLEDPVLNRRRWCQDSGAISFWVDPGNPEGKQNPAQLSGFWGEDLVESREMTFDFGPQNRKPVLVKWGGFLAVLPRIGDKGFTSRHRVFSHGVFDGNPDIFFENNNLH